MPALDAEVLLRGLTGGMTLDAFNEGIRETRPAKFAAAFGVEDLDELFTLSRLEALFTQASIPLHVDVFDAGNLRRFVDVQHKSGKSGIEVAADSLRQGATLRVRDVDQFDARLNRFACEVRRHFAAQSDINVYLTPPGKSGFAAHFDTTDVFIVQCRGSKEWRVFHGYTNQAQLPLADTNWDPNRFRPSAQFDAMTLCRGDVLYLPRGTMHQAFCTEQESMHLTISIAPLTFADLLVTGLKGAAEKDIELRRRVPWPNDDDDAGYETLARQVRERLQKLPEQVDIPALLKVGHRPQTEGAPACTGALESVITSLKPLCP